MTNLLISFLPSNNKIFSQKPALWITLIIGLVTFSIYFEVINHEFISFDDGEYVYENYLVKKGLTIKGFVSAFKVWSQDLGKVSYWHPLTWLSHMTDIELFGLNAGMHHLVNLLLHVINAILLFTILRLMSGALWRSALVAVLFAVHPINVDTVAWIAERKNLLSSFFWMLTMLLYLRYVKNLSRLYYALSILTFTLGLLAKPMLVSLPFVFLLLDYWPLQRLNISPSTDPLNLHEITIRNAIKEKVPFFILSIITVAISSWSLHLAGIATSFKEISLFQRITTAFASYALYIIKLFLPFNLTYFYPYPEAMLPLWQIASSAIALIAITVLCAVQYKKKPYLIVGWLWFGITLFPVSGLMQGGAWPLIAERWAYITTIGIFLMFSWGVFDLFSGVRIHKKILPAFIILLLISLSVLTLKQVGYWINGSTLYRHALSIYPNDHISHTNLGLEYANNSKIDEAIHHFQESIRIRPGHAATHLDLGTIYFQQNRLDEAIREYKIAVKLKPDLGTAYYNLGLASYASGNLNEATQYYIKAITLNPNNYMFYKYLGIALLEEGKTEDAIDAFKTSVELIPPDDAELYFYLGSAYSINQELASAETYLVKALFIKPNYPKARIELGNVFLKKKLYDNAIRQFLVASSEDKKSHDIYTRLGIAYFYKGMFDEAVKTYETALSLNNNSAEAYNNLGSALLAQGKINESIVQFRKALEIKPDYADAQMNLETALKFKSEKTFDASMLGKILSLDNFDPYELIRIGHRYQSQGEIKRATEYYNKALSVKPDLLSARNNLGVAKMRMGKYDEAGSLFMGILKDKPNDIEALYNLACLYSIQDKPVEALKWLEEAFNKGFNNWSLLNDDADLSNLRKTVIFKKLMYRVRKR